MFLLNDFISFIKRPTIQTPIKLGNILLFSKTILFGVLILILIDITSGFIIFPLKYFSLFPTLKPFQYNTYNILRVTLILPIVEELVFRLPLRISKINLIVFLSMVCFISLYKVNIFIAGFLSVMIILLGLNLIRSKSIYLVFLNKLILANFPIFFFTQAIIFGGLHLFNYDLLLKNLFILPFIVLGQILTGMFLGFLRVKYSNGIILCISIHILINTLYCLILT
jgi:hypothetical protein